MNAFLTLTHIQDIPVWLQPLSGSRTRLFSPQTGLNRVVTQKGRSYKTTTKYEQSTHNLRCYKFKRKNNVNMEMVHHSHRLTWYYLCVCVWTWLFISHWTFAITTWKLAKIYPFYMSSCMCACLRACGCGCSRGEEEIKRGKRQSSSLPNCNKRKIHRQGRGLLLIAITSFFSICMCESCLGLLNLDRRKKCSWIHFHFNSKLDKR